MRGNRVGTPRHAVWMLAVCWAAGWGVALERETVEQPRYEIVAERDDFEIRAYAPQVVARVRVEGPAGGAMSRGFRPLADYIFGNNARRDGIAMTAPVTQTGADSAMKIAMTAPVTQTPAAPQEGTNAAPEAHWVMFIMPEEHRLGTLPTPNDPRVELLELPKRTMAVARVPGQADHGAMLRVLDALLGRLAEAEIPVAGEPTFARYDPPWTPPGLRRNEVMVPVAWPEE